VAAGLSRRSVALNLYIRASIVVELPARLCLFGVRNRRLICSTLGDKIPERYRMRPRVAREQRLRWAYSCGE